MSFSGLKTAVITQASKLALIDEQTRADISLAFEEAVVDLLVAKSVAAIRETGYDRLVVAGGVGANTRLREVLTSKLQRHKAAVYYPPTALCTDNGAMIALVGALRLAATDPNRRPRPKSFAVRPRWSLEMISR